MPDKMEPVFAHPEQIRVMQDLDFEEVDSEQSGHTTWSHLLTSVRVECRNSVVPTIRDVLTAAMNAAEKRGAKKQAQETAATLKQLLNP